MTHRPPLTRERIIETALHLVDGQGLGRLTMRRLGDMLEVEAMAIYHHLPSGKEQLLDGLVGHVAAMPVAPGSGAWRGRLADWAAAYRERLMAHDGVMPLLVTRRNSGALLETTLSLRDVLTSAGFAPAAAQAGAHAALSYLIGHVAQEARATRATDAVEEVDGGNWDTRFLNGLELVLTGISGR